jgi:Protein of unknown function (DUF3015)
MKKYIFLVAILILFSSKAFAAGYGDAGCGLGALLFHDQTGPVQILAATTNGTSFNQAFGISSGTSECDAKSVILAQKQQENFVSNNFSGIAKDMAAGEGEHLSALAGLMGCPAVEQARFNSVTQGNYKVIFAKDSTTPSEALSAVRAVVSQDAQLSGSCSN